MKSKFAGIQYLGDSGVTQICKEAIIRLTHAGEDIKDVKILTFEEAYSHAQALLLTLRYDIQVIIKDGFASGYNGEAPKGYAFVLNLLCNYTDSINEYIISKSIFERISSSSLTVKDLEYINSINPVRPARWYESAYTHKEREHSIFSEFPLTIPMALLDPHLIELALDLIRVQTMQSWVHTESLSLSLESVQAYIMKVVLGCLRKLFKLMTQFCIGRI